MIDFLTGVKKSKLAFGISIFAFFTTLETSDKAAGTYPGCTAPPSSFVKAFTATPMTLSSILNTATAGDIIYLSSGNYGAVSISSRKYSQFLMIKAASGQNPVLSSLTVNSVSHMLFAGLTINGNGVRSKSPDGILVNLASSNSIVFEENIVESTSGAFPWKAETTDKTVLDASFAPSDGINASQDYCVAISSNQIRNVFKGIYVGGDQVGTDGQNYIVSDNMIDHFAGDGIDHSATNIIIQANHITNALDICGSQCIHNDGIQGWNWNDKLGITNKNVDIDTNYIQSQTGTYLALASNDLHGISIFDGFWGNVSITNNVVLTSSLSGITIAGVNGLNIINNSVMNIPMNGASQSQAYWMYSGMTWITAGGTTHEGGATRNVIVRNNIAPLIAATAAASGNCPITESFCSSTANPNVEQDHNLSLVQKSYTAQNLFVTFNTSTAQYNLELKGAAATDPAIGSGSASLMPTTDFLGHSRNPASPDLGAYAQ
jgi:hypothetical protein